MSIPAQLKLFVATALSYVLLHSLPITPSVPSVSKTQWQPFNLMATARSSGGRSRGGSFRSSSGHSRGNSSRSPARRFSPSVNRAGGFARSPFRSPRYDRRDRPGTAIVGGSLAAPRFLTSVVIVGLTIGAGILIFIVVYATLSALRKKSSPQAKMERVRDNNTVTVSKLQIALLAYAGDLQNELTALTAESDLSSQSGTWKLLHETLQALLRYSEHWAYVESSSESMTLSKAETRFESLSQEERQKMEEILTNLNGTFEQNSQATLSGGESTFIVVTLILGTADDDPLFAEIRTADRLRTVFKQLAAKRADYLRVVEVLWSPQAPDHSLPFDEFVMEYPTMIKLV